MQREPSNSRGDFFIIDGRFLPLLADCGLNPFVAYLVLATGTGPGNKTSNWSVNAIQTYTGMTFERGVQAIERLAQAGVISKTKGGTRPQYELSSWPGWSALRREQRDSILTPFEREVLAGRVLRKSKKHTEAMKKLESLGWYMSLAPLIEAETDDERREHLIWLPKTLVMGTPAGEEAPLRRLRALRRVSTLRLLIGLYHAQNLRDDFGVKRTYLWQTYTRKRRARIHGVTVWSFTAGTPVLRFKGPFAFLKNYPKELTEDQREEHTVWIDVTHLSDLGLIKFVPHLVEGEDEEAEIVHAYGLEHHHHSGTLEAEEGRVAWDAAITARAALRLANSEWQSDEHGFLYPAFSNVRPSVQMVGIARLTYRAHTSRTSAWYARALEALEQARGEFERVRNSLR